MKFILIGITFFFTCIVSAQTGDVIELWPNEVPNETRPKQAPIQIKRTKGDILLKDVTNPTLTVYKTEHPNASRAGVIVCPGGGYSGLAITKEGYEVAEWLNDLGYTAFVLEYRVPKNREGALQDMQRAIRWVRIKSVFYDLDAQKIGVMGFSAGGHLSANASTNYQKETYNKIDSIDNFSSRPNFSMLIYPAYLDNGDNKSLSSELSIDKNTPPFFVFGTSDDRYGNSTLVFAKALRDKEIPVELHLLAKGGHGYGLRKGNIAAKTWPILAETWMENMLNSREIAKYQRMLNFPNVEEFPENIPQKKDVWVFLMAGQSNMAGRGFVEPQDTIPSPRILTINRQNAVILAKEPFHFYESTGGGLDSGMSFSKHLLKDIPENVSVLIIPTAVGGSAIKQWVGDSIHREVKLLSNFKEKVALAKTYGQIKGILWHQGESDANKTDIPEYDKNLSILFKAFRRTVGNKKTPILVGELGGFRSDSETWKSINNILHEHAKKDKYMYLIDTSDLKDKGDNLHFDSESQRILGKRFAEVFTKKSININ